MKKAMAFFPDPPPPKKKLTLLQGVQQTRPIKRGVVLVKITPRGPLKMR